ncbi:MAG: hypothetical protein GY856_20410, partial [bacterium]|nr:hypothetical protein [bacterium]
TPDQGVETLGRILALPDPGRVVISTGRLESRIEQWVSAPRLTPAAAGVGPAISGSELEQRIAEIWCRVLGVDEVGTRDNFFDLGGDSLLAMQLVSELHRQLGVQIAPLMLFEAPTVGALAELLSPDQTDQPTAPPSPPAATPTEGSEIAVVGISGRFPGAGSIDEFWQNLCAGRESITFFDDDQLLAAGVDPEILSDPLYVKARPILDDVELFDAGLFGYSPREAEIMDPQHRIFLECAWQALEDAGYDTSRYHGRVGVYAGTGFSSYLQQLHSNPELMRSVDSFQTLIGNDKDALTTRVSYKLDLRGPSI